MKTENHNQVNENGDTWYEKPVVKIETGQEPASSDDDEVKPKKRITDKEFRSMSFFDRFECSDSF